MDSNHFKDFDGLARIGEELREFIAVSLFDEDAVFTTLLDLLSNREPVQQLSFSEEQIDVLGRIAAKLRIWIEANEPVLARSLAEVQRLSKELKRYRQRPSVPENETYPYWLEFFQRHRWGIAHNMEAGFLRHAVQTAEQSGNPGATLGRIITEFYLEDDCRELSGLVDSWKNTPVMKDRNRYKILKDTVAALRLRSSRFNAANLVVPTLICQIEGAIHDYCASKGLVNTWRGYRDSDGKLKKRSQVLQETLFLHALYEQHPYMPRRRTEYDDMSTALLRDILYRNAHPGEPLETWGGLNRHKILHGEVTSYGRIDNAVRCYLMLDYICMLR